MLLGRDAVVRARARLDILAVRLVRLSVGPFGDGFAPPGNARPQWLFSYHERGRAALATSEWVVPLPPGRAVLISPALMRSAKPDGQARELAALFELSAGRSYAPPFTGEGPLVLDPNALRDGLSRGLLEQLRDGAPPTPSQAARAQALIHLCVASALESAAETERTTAASLDASSQLLPALRYIDAHLAEVLPNAKLAELAHASESHFIRMFRRVLGRTPARHVQERRVASAAHLLTGTGLSIEEIAERCGFANRYHFTRVFAQFMSHPPARFRALHGNRAVSTGFDTAP